MDITVSNRNPVGAQPANLADRRRLEVFPVRRQMEIWGRAIELYSGNRAKAWRAAITEAGRTLELHDQAADAAADALDGALRVLVIAAEEYGSEQTEDKRGTFEAAAFHCAGNAKRHADVIAARADWLQAKEG